MATIGAGDNANVDERIVRSNVDDVLSPQASAVYIAQVISNSRSGS